MSNESNFRTTVFHGLSADAKAYLEQHNYKIIDNYPSGICCYRENHMFRIFEGPKEDVISECLQLETFTDNQHIFTRLEDDYGFAFGQWESEEIKELLKDD